MTTEAPEPSVLALLNAYFMVTALTPMLRRFSTDLKKIQHNTGEK